MEIFLDNSLYSVYDMKSDFTGVNRKLFIPKKKVKGTKTWRKFDILLREEVFQTNPMAAYIGSLLHGL